jgi:hypothetical protein
MRIIWFDILRDKITIFRKIRQYSPFNLISIKIKYIQTILYGHKKI